MTDEEIEITVLEQSDADRRDKEAWQASCQADFPDAETQKKKHEADRKRRYRAENREKVRAYHKRYREKRADHYKALNRSYYLKHRERLYAIKEEKRKRKKQLAALNEPDHQAKGAQETNET